MVPFLTGSLAGLAIGLHLRRYYEFPVSSSLSQALYIFRKDVISAPAQWSDRFLYPKLLPQDFSIQSVFVSFKMKHPGSRMSDFLVLKELGKGSYGVVSKVRSIRTSESYVLKSINLKHLSSRKQQESLREVQILRSLSHPNIIKYHGSFLENESLHIIMEYAAHGDLQKLINSYKEAHRRLTEQEIWKYSSELASGLRYLHGKRIIHRDVKCLNVLLSADGTAKLGDFGASRCVDQDMQATKIGTPLYLAPEQVKQLPYDFKVDIWALGCVLYTLASLCPPFKGNNLIALGISIVSMKPKPIPVFYSKKLGNFISSLLDKRPAKRPSLQEIGALLSVENSQEEMSTLAPKEEGPVWKFPVLSANVEKRSARPATAAAPKEAPAAKKSERAPSISFSNKKAGAELEEDSRPEAPRPRTSSGPRPPLPSALFSISSRELPRNLLFRPRPLSGLQRAVNCVSIHTISNRVPRNDRRVRVSDLRDLS